MGIAQIVPESSVTCTTTKLATLLSSPATVTPIGSQTWLVSPTNPSRRHVQDRSTHQRTPLISTGPNDTTTYVTLFVNSSSTSSGSTHSRFYNYNGPPSYDPVSGRGAIGVEFAGTAVTSGSPFGSAAASPTLADTRSQLYVSVNADLQWSEGYYRGFFTLKLDPNNAFASYYAMRNTSTSFVYAYDAQ